MQFTFQENDKVWNPLFSMSKKLYLIDLHFPVLDKDFFTLYWQEVISSNCLIGGACAKSFHVKIAAPSVFPKTIEKHFSSNLSRVKLECMQFNIEKLINVSRKCIHSVYYEFESHCQVSSKMNKGEFSLEINSAQKNLTEVSAITA